MAAQKLLQKALKRYEKANKGRVDVSMLARQCGLSYSTVYHPLYSGRNARADTWLLIMQALGAIKQDAKALHIRKAS
jgi:DNA-binding phage protein